MLELHLDPEEVSVLLQMIDDHISDLRVEITATDNINYKEVLKKRKEILLKLQTAFQQESGKQTRVK